MMPRMDGQQVLKHIRALEDQHRVEPAKAAKVIMTTALSDPQNLIEAIPRCDAYLTKPVDRADLMFHVRKFGLMCARPDNTSKERPTGPGTPWGKEEKDMPWVG